MRISWTPVCLCFLAVAALASCSSSTTEKSATTPSAQVPSPAEESPDVCSDLAADPAITGLTSAVRVAILSEQTASRLLLVGAESLRAYAEAFPAATGAADALSRLSETPTEPAALDALATTFGDLDREVQAQCRFPLS